MDKEMTSLLYSRSHFGDIHLVSAQTIIKNKVSLMLLSFPYGISWYLLESVTAIDFIVILSNRSRFYSDAGP